jgi:hypothetical protein
LQVTQNDLRRIAADHCKLNKGSITGSMLSKPAIPLSAHPADRRQMNRDNYQDRHCGGWMTDMGASPTISRSTGEGPVLVSPGVQEAAMEWPESVGIRASRKR